MLRHDNADLRLTELGPQRRTGRRQAVDADSDARRVASLVLRDTLSDDASGGHHAFPNVAPA